MVERKQEITKIALDCFVRNGLLSTSMKDVAKDVGVNAGALYYYYDNKEEMVTQCAEMAIREIAENLMERAIAGLDDVNHLTDRLLEAARKYMPVMRFIVSVRASMYGENITKALEAFSAGYDSYVERFAAKLGCDSERVRQITYMLIISTTNYMIFGESSLFIRQLEPIRNDLNKLIGEIKHEVGAQ